MAHILEFIQATRDSFIGAEHVYANGSCYYFAKMLEVVYPEGSLFETRDHVYFLLDGKYYDITGEKPRPRGAEFAAEPTRHGKYNLTELYEKLERRTR